MDVGELDIAGALVFTPRQHHDDRGVFLEYFRADLLEQSAGRSLDLRQANCSVSSAGTLRGVHYADVPPGQAKYVTCTVGSFLDVVVDLRVGSPTFGRWEAVRLDTTDRRAVFIPEGLGHAALALEDGSTLLYLCSTTYAPGREHGIHPLDADVAIQWPTEDAEGRNLSLVLSDKDKAAPTLAEALAGGGLPTMEATTAYTSSLAAPTTRG